MFIQEGGRPHLQKATKNGRDTEAGALGHMRDFTEGSLKVAPPNGLAVLPGSTRPPSPLLNLYIGLLHRL